MGDMLQKAIIENVKAQFQERLSSIRHPETGEFPTIVVLGDSLEDLRLQIEGSPELLALVQERLAPEDMQSVSLVETPRDRSPKVFLSYGFEDRLTAEAIARQLQAAGVDTWWAEWEIGAGDSLRQKIDEGLGQCTHFIVLLTTTSIAKPWVNQEIDAALIRKLSGQCKLIVLRQDLPVGVLSPLLSGTLSPEIDAINPDLSQLISEIHGLTKKPPLGPAPNTAIRVGTGYSPAATAIAEVFVRDSKYGMFGDLQFTVEELSQRVNLSAEDVTDALHEIRDMVKIGHSHVLPKGELYATFDSFWMPWNPEHDALRLAADFVNDKEFPISPSEIATRYDWQPRRLNPAISYLDMRHVVHALKAMGTAPFTVVVIRPTDETRRFVRSRTL